LRWGRFGPPALRRLHPAVAPDRDNGRVAESGDRGRHLLVLGAGPAQLGLLETAKAHGIWTAVCDRNPGAPGFALADRRCIVSIEDEPAIERLASALELDGLISPGTDPAVAVAARVAEKLGLAHPITPAVAQVVTNKVRQRETLAAAGIPHPRWQVAAAETKLELELPVVVKIYDRAGHTGLTLVRRASELSPALADARKSSRSGAVLVEEYVDGPEVTVTGFSADGEFVPLAVTDRITADGPAFGVPLAQIWPSPHAEAAAEVTRRAVEALGIDEGPSCTQLRISRGGPEVLEVGARLGGGADAELVELVTGIDLNALALAAALGQPLAASELKGAFRPSVGGAATWFLVSPPGVLESVEVPQGLKGVVSTRVYREPGYVFGELRRPSDRAGAVLAAGSTREEALARVREAVERIRFLTADAEAIV
jgi:biotin carboxylase